LAGSILCNIFKLYSGILGRTFDNYRTKGRFKIRPSLWSVSFNSSDYLYPYRRFQTLSLAFKRIKNQSSNSCTAPPFVKSGLSWNEGSARKDTCVPFSISKYLKIIGLAMELEYRTAFTQENKPQRKY